MKAAPSEKDKQRFQKAMKALDGGKPSEALKLFSKVRKSWGDDPDIGYLEGLAYGKLGNAKEIINVSNRALKLAPDHFGALSNLANAQMGMGSHEQALQNYEKALQQKPDAHIVLDNYGRALSGMGRREEAIDQYNKVIKLNPSYAPVYAALGKAYAESGYPEKALEIFKKAVQIDSKSGEAHVGLGVLFSGMGKLEEAENHFNAALRINRKNYSAYVGMANLKRYSGEMDKVHGYLKQAEAIIQGDDPGVQSLKAEMLEREGDKEKAYEIIKQMIEADSMNFQAAIVFSRLARKFERVDEALEMIDNIINKPATNVSEKQALMFAAGDLLDKLNRYEEAMAYYQKANSALDISCDREAYVRKHDEIINGFSRDALSKFPRATTRSNRPVFVLGMPRSGTSLTEQILATHTNVYGAGELFFINQIESVMQQENATLDDYAAIINTLDQSKLTEMAQSYLDNIKQLNSKAKYVIDKMPHNLFQIGLISLLFPEARIIHCKRNPLDNCLSIYFQSFIWAHDYAMDLADIGFFYNEYERMMAHWEEVIDNPILTVQYEDILKDQEAVSRQLLDFCGLEWDDSVMKFYESKRDVGTASYDQVRQPIYQSSKERWKNYEAHLAVLIKELDS